MTISSLSATLTSAQLINEDGQLLPVGESTTDERIEEEQTTPEQYVTDITTGKDIATTPGPFLTIDDLVTELVTMETVGETDVPESISASIPSLTTEQTIEGVVTVSETDDEPITVNQTTEYYVTEGVTEVDSSEEVDSTTVQTEMITTAGVTDQEEAETEIIITTGGPEDISTELPQTFPIDDESTETVTEVEDIIMTTEGTLTETLMPDATTILEGSENNATTFAEFETLAPVTVPLDVDITTGETMTTESTSSWLTTDLSEETTEPAMFDTTTETAMLDMTTKTAMLDMTTVTAMLDMTTETAMFDTTNEPMEITTAPVPTIPRIRTFQTTDVHTTIPVTSIQPTTTVIQTTIIAEHMSTAEVTTTRRDLATEAPIPEVKTMNSTEMTQEEVANAVTIELKGISVSIM